MHKIAIELTYSGTFKVYISLAYVISYLMDHLNLSLQKPLPQVQQVSLIRLLLLFQVEDAIIGLGDLVCQGKL